jgi:AraC-like DNA-binding protein
MAWHRRHRIERAKLDLLEGQQSVKAVAQRWGFHSPAHFTRVFTAEVGVAPVRWVKQEQRGGPAGCA